MNAGERLRAPGVSLAARWPTCPECSRRFDLLDEDDAGEWYYGHDCDASTLCDCCGIECDAVDAWTDGTWSFCGSLYGNGCDQTEPAKITGEAS